MHALIGELPMVLDAPESTSRQAEWGGMTVARETFAAGLDPSPLFQGLPDDRCPCPHWGYVVRGRFRVKYADREESVGAGEAYNLTPGHLVIFDEETEIVEFSPRETLKRTMDVVARNLASMA